MLPERGVVVSALRHAICLVSVNDADLLGEEANERSVMFRIGLYLANIIGAEWSGGWNVDLEYNRMNSGRRRVPKAVLGLHLDDRDRTRNVYPDLIVHRRGRSGKAANLLIVEAKKTPFGLTAGDFDIRKLEIYRRDLGYRHAIYLELSRQPRWQWIGVDKQLVAVA